MSGEAGEAAAVVAATLPERKLWGLADAKGNFVLLVFEVGMEVREEKGVRACWVAWGSRGSW